MQSAQEFIARRYSRAVALQHEFVYGPGYQGPAEQQVFEYLTQRVGPKIDGGHVMDLGCGLGGDAFRLAEQHNATVTAIDASSDMISLCNERALEINNRSITFAVDEISNSTLAQKASPFDVVWSRDCGAFLPFEAKERVWRRVREWLTVDGRLLITDYCLGQNTVSQVLLDQMLSWGQYMVSPGYYDELLCSLGYTNVDVVDRTDLLLISMENGIRKLREKKDEFTAAFGEVAYDGVLGRWKRKIEYCRDGQLLWTVAVATSPSV